MVFWVGFPTFGETNPFAKLLAFFFGVTLEVGKIHIFYNIFRHEKTLVQFGSLAFIFRTSSAWI